MSYDRSHSPTSSFEADAADLLAQLHARDPWSADALSGAIGAHPDLLIMLAEEIRLLLRAPEGMAGVCPPITRLEWQQDAAANPRLRADLTDEELVAMNEVLDRVRIKVARALARRGLRKRLRQEFIERRLRVPPMPSN
jgi:hypothetical protein